MTAKGWIKLHRRIQEHQLWRVKRKFSKAEAWLDILLSVRFSTKPEKRLIGEKQFICRYGESLRSVKTWAERWGWSRSVTHRFLKYLESERMIGTVNETVTTRISVVNFKRYQLGGGKSGTASGTEDGTQAERARDAAGTQADTEEEGKEGEEGDIKSASEPLALAATAKGDRSGSDGQPKRRKKQQYSPEFDLAWAAYGRRGTKPKAAKRFDEAVKRIAGRDNAPTDPKQWLIERTGTFTTLHDAGNEKKFRPYYAKWLDEEQYDFNEADMRQASGGSASSSLAFMHDQTEKMLADDAARFQAPGDTAP